jgi:putrescine transport system permease protein
MIGRILWLEFFQNRDWPVACAIATVLAAILAGPILLFDRLRSRKT